ncbi:hypothetical protein MNB_SM-7-408 [hydrothermal vent metagenome]|uniref:Spermatogenesis-associated protein 20-like TRX domain-containing protein n=1 Tax=hydrothermal vent metagenome TaxID=652676 RepID=A0A1W1BSN2_9ZZZZ
MIKLLLLLFLSFALFGAQIEWLESYKKAEVLSQKRQKPIYLFISAAECPWCEKMEKTTLKDPKVIKLLEEKFIPLYLVRDFDTIPSRFAVRPVPRHYVVFDQKHYFYEDLGYMPKDTFIKMLNFTLKEMKK